MSSWAFVVGPWNGPLEGELSRPRSRKVTFRLSSAGKSEASCEVDGRGPDAALIRELVTDLHVLRRPSPDKPRQRLFRGRVGKTADKLDRTSHTVTVPAVDYRGVLDRRILATGSKQLWNDNDDLGTVALGLLGQAQNKTGGDYGIATGITSVLGVLAGKREFKLGDSISAKIQELSESTIGFDWDITPSLDPGSTAMQMDMWSPQRGVDRGEIVEYGAAVDAFDRTINSGEYANAVRLTGTAPEGSQQQPAIQERYAPGLATAAEGRWDKVFGTDVTSTDGLEARADWQSAQAQVVQPSYSLKMRRGWWDGPSHVWLGDTVRLRAKSGPRIQIDTPLRVQEIDVAIDDDGIEDVTLSVGQPRPDYRQRAADVDRRLSTLERR